MEADEFSKKLGGASSFFSKLINGDDQKIADIDEKLEAAEGNYKQGMVGYSFATDKVEDARE